MSDKSPRQHMSKKQGKTIKEKRADKKGKADAATSAIRCPEQRSASASWPPRR